MSPPLAHRLVRLLQHDTSLARLVVATGLLILGFAMMMGVGSGAPGYTLMEEALPLQLWGAIYAGVGGWGVYGSVNRLPYWLRVMHTMAGMYLWVFLALAQFNDQALPTRLLLILPALVEMLVLVKTVVMGPRKGGY